MLLFLLVRYLYETIVIIRVYYKPNQMVLVILNEKIYEGCFRDIVNGTIYRAAYQHRDSEEV